MRPHFGALIGFDHPRLFQQHRPKTELLGQPIRGLKEAFYGSTNNIVVTYESLVFHPEKTMRTLYGIMDIEYYHHDFDNVEHRDEEFDAGLGLPGLHDVRGKVAYSPKKELLPPDIKARYQGDSFWLSPAAVDVVRDRVKII